MIATGASAAMGSLRWSRQRKRTSGLRIFNPDGSEAEKSGNGLRIFARYLHATGKTNKKRFTVETKGGLVTIALHVDRHGDASAVTVEMGRAHVPAGRTSLYPHDQRADRTAHRCRRPISHLHRGECGNPHCVIFKPVGQSWSREDLLKLGPALENHSLFPKRTNVQLAVPTGPRELFILIWERGAGETQASGSSSCAAASAAVRLGLVKSPVTVKDAGR